MTAVALTLPSEVVWVLDLLGYTWPEADEEKLIECGQAWLEFASQVGQTENRGSSAAQAVVSANSGQAVEAFTDSWRDFSGGPGAYLAEAQIAAEVIGVAFEVAAAEVLAAKIEVIVQLVILATEIIAAQAAAPFTLGLSEAGALGATQATRLIVRRLFDEMKRKVIQAVTKAMEEAATKGIKKIASDFMKHQVKDFAKDYAKKTAKEVIVDPAKEKAKDIAKSAGQNVIQQGMETNFGARKGIDLGETAEGAKEEFGKQFGTYEDGQLKPGEYFTGSKNDQGEREGGVAGLADPATHRDRLVDQAKEAGKDAASKHVEKGVQHVRGGDGEDVRSVFG
ncbi:PE-PGRS family protein [Streptomyces celluloflavus]|uniref:WXG100-like domain-containing protein n=1 Tax=Streptomyces celluloflavus TaxID=58344 RepID=UPI0037AC7DE5